MTEESKQLVNSLESAVKHITQFICIRSSCTFDGDVSPTDRIHKRVESRMTVGVIVVADRWQDVNDLFVHR